MTTSPDEPTTGSDEQESLRDLARERVEDMPAETALGHADPAGGADGDPQTYEGDDNS